MIKIGDDISIVAICVVKRIVVVEVVGVALVEVVVVLVIGTDCLVQILGWFLRRTLVEFNHSPELDHR